MITIIIIRITTITMGLFIIHIMGPIIILTIISITGHTTGMAVMVSASDNSLYR